MLDKELQVDTDNQKTQIMISLRQIRDYQPCSSGWRRVVRANATNPDNPDFDRLFPVSSILDSNDLEETLWVLRCLPEYDLLWHKFAWWVAYKVSYMVDTPQVHDGLNTLNLYCEGLETKEELQKVHHELKKAFRSCTPFVTRMESRVIDLAEHATRSDASLAVAYAAEYAQISYPQGEARQDLVKAQEAKLRAILDAGTWVN